MKIKDTKKLRKLIKKSKSSKLKNLNLKKLNGKEVKALIKILKNGNSPKKILKKFESFKSGLKSKNKKSKKVSTSKTTKKRSGDEVLYSKISSDFRDVPQKSKDRIIISFLGFQTYGVKNGFRDKKSHYISKIDGLQIKGEYYDMFHLLGEKFAEDSKLIFIGTEKAIELHHYIGKYYQLPKVSVKNIEEIGDENDFHNLFRKIDELILKEMDTTKEIIIDLTHGFRHIPILSIISIITRNIDYQNISKILFAKIAGNNGYEIIDLREFIDIANINYALQNFKTGYFLLEVPEVKKSEYNELLKDIHEFSKMVVGNFFGEILKPNSISNSLLKKIDKILDGDDTTFFKALTEIKEHLKDMQKIANLNDKYKQFYKLSNMFKERKFYLNSIILLNEAVGQYLGNYIRTLNIPEVQKSIAENETSEKFDYKLAQNSKAIFQELNNRDFSHTFLNQSKTVTGKIRERIKASIPEKNINEIIEFLNDLKNLRNSISHGDLSIDASDIEKKIEKLFGYFEKIIETKLLIVAKKEITSEKQDAITENDKLTQNEYGYICQQKLNYTATIKLLDELRSTKDASLRIPNITELEHLFEKKIISNQNYWSSTEVYNNSKKVYIFRKGKVGENSKQATHFSIFVSKTFSPIKDSIGEEKRNEKKMEEIREQESKEASEEIKKRLKKLNLSSRLNEENPII